MLYYTESNGKLQHLFIPSNTAILVPEIAVKVLPLGISADLVLEFAVKDLPLGRTLMMMMDLYHIPVDLFFRPKHVIKVKKIVYDINSLHLKKSNLYNNLT